MVAAKKPINNREQRPKLSVPERTARRGHVRPPATITPHTSADSSTSPSPAPDNKWPVTAKLVTGVRQLPFAKKVIIVSVIGLAVIGLSVYRHDTSTSSRVSDPNAVIENLEYQTVLPGGKSIDTLGGWKRVSPSGSEPVYAYVDSINGIPVSVSQQPLPNSFKNDIDSQVSDLAKKFNATTKLDAGGTKVYLGTSAKGPQSVILTKNGLLILIKSQQKIDDSAWTDYAQSLN